MKSLFEKAQQFGKSFMLPIAILPAAGLLLGIGGALVIQTPLKHTLFRYYLITKYFYINVSCR